MMRLAPFELCLPGSVEEAVAEKLAAPPDAAFVAGGTDLYPNMKRRHQEPSTLISLQGIPELRTFEFNESGVLTIGAMCSLTEIEKDERVSREHPALAATMRLISTPILRNMGTIGGNLLLDTRCNYYDQGYEWRKSIDFCMKKDGEICWVAPASPRCWAVQSSDSAPLLVALGASAELKGPEGDRTIPVGALYRDDGILYLAKKKDELLTKIHLPAPNGWRASYRKLRRRGSFDFPVLGVGAWVSFDGDGAVTDARIVLGGLGSHPRIVEEAAEPLLGSPLTEEAAADAADIAWKVGRPLDNTDFTLSWRKEMVRPYVRRAIADLTREA